MVKKRTKNSTKSKPSTYLVALLVAAFVIVGGLVLYIANIATRNSLDGRSHAMEFTGGLVPNMVDCAPGPDVVTFYDTKYFGGGCYANSGVNDYPNPGNINADSIKVGANVKVTLYTDVNHGGRHITIYADALHLAMVPFNVVGDNAIKSYTVETKAHYAGPVPYPTTDPFYPQARCLSAVGILDQGFGPSGSYATRAELTRLAIRATQYNDQIFPTPHFFDVPTSNDYFTDIERSNLHHVVNGYGCGAHHAAGEGCGVGYWPPSPTPGSLPYNNPNSLGYFEPNVGITRGQTAKIVVEASGLDYDHIPTNGNYTFGDVPPTAPFWRDIEIANGQGIISGYPCGTGHGDCDSMGRRVFSPNASVTRGQALKFIVQTWFPGGCTNWQ